MRLSIFSLFFFVACFDPTEPTEITRDQAPLFAAAEEDPLGHLAPLCQGAPIGLGVGCFSDRVVVCEANGPVLAPPCQTFQQCMLEPSGGGGFVCENRPCTPPSFCGQDRDTGRPTAYHCYEVEQSPGWRENTCAPNETCQLNDRQVAECTPATCDPQFSTITCIEESKYTSCDASTNTMKISDCAEGSSCGHRGIPVEHGCFNNGAVDCSLAANESAAWCDNTNSMLFYCQDGKKKSKNCYNFSCGWDNVSNRACLEPDPE